ncbi:MAG: GGDEF domain-containing protein [Lachnospiraceae bacterium]|nr:GGDEF domain-containing protein [Lachnospiraceae bacterium]
MENDSKEKTFEEKTFEQSKKQYMRINTLLLVIHIFLSIPYILLSPDHMAIVNVFSILFYIIGYMFIKKSLNAIIIYTYLILLEILIHDVFCVLIFGWQCGFQLWLISLVATYIKDYITPGISQKVRNIISAVMILLGFLTFTALYLITKYVNLPVEDHPSESVTSFFMIMNSFITFLGIGAFTRIYTTQMEYRYSELHQQADFDQLTELGNRYYMNDVLTEKEKDSNSDSGYSVAMVDIDHFKMVNDNYGHHSGDIVLRDIADILSRNLPENIKPGRWGGEEFLLVADKDIAFNEFIEILENLRKIISSHEFILENNKKINCTISIGVAKYRSGLSIEEMIKVADNNLYKAKNTGRNQLISE